MNEVTKYFVLGFSALVPLINPPGSALELLSIVGLANVEPYKTLAKKISVNMLIFLAVAGFAGPYVLEFFGISKLPLPKADNRICQRGVLVGLDLACVCLSNLIDLHGLGHTLATKCAHNTSCNKPRQLQVY